MHPDIKFFIEKQINYFISFLDVLISLIKIKKSSYTGLLLNFKSFTWYSDKASLIKYLIDESFYFTLKVIFVLKIFRFLP